ncbi:MAG: PQQ-binding-like beta-propeller repeat protein [Planctomycetes bacterium]|nr:PQQ-binding-like beta-propeller repeat protein [Planctomycetota bacterium]
MRRILLLSLLGAVPAMAVEPVVATPWDVRKESQELLDDLDAKRGEEASLLERVQTLIATHGDQLISCKDGGAPIADVLEGRLHEAGLDKAFVRTYEAVADKHLSVAVSEADLTAVARGYPGTPAAGKAWSLLANRAWDSGRIGQFLECSRRSGDRGSADGKQREAAAQAMLIQSETPDLPTTLDGLAEIWSFEVEEHRVRQVRTQDRPVQPVLSLSAASGEATAASDGVRFFVFDHLIGRQQGSTQVVGNIGLSQLQARPVVTPQGFVAIGNTDNQKISLLCLDRLGERRWQASSQQQGSIVGVSPVISLDQLVAFAVIIMDNENADLHVQAFDARSGKQAWDALVARVPGARRSFNAGESALIPSLCLHEGSLLVLSNCGIIGCVGPAGEVRRVWNYPSLTTDENLGGMPGLTRSTRRGLIAGNGLVAIATPSDNQGVALILGEGNQSPILYRGDGAKGDVLAVSGGFALFSGSVISCLDIAQRKARWNYSAKLTDSQGCVGNGRALVAGKESMVLLDLATGKVVGQRTFGAFDASYGLAVVDQTLLLGRPSQVTSYGGTTSTLDRLTEAANQNPKDFRPRARLASLLQVHGDLDLAFDRYVEALERGAPAEYAEKAARIARQRLDLSVGEAKLFPQALAKLERLARFDPSLAAETAYWRARNSEASGNKAAAAADYQSVLTLPGRSIAVRDKEHVEVHLHALARAGLARIGGKDAGLVGTGPETIPTPAAGKEWTVAAHRARATLISGEMAVGYADGFLVANRIVDGTEAWWRKPERPLLGVQWQQGNAGAGIRIEVIPGTSADTAGMRTGDFLVEFSGKEIRDFQHDLVPAVKSAGIRTPFTAVVLRGETKVAINGILGGDMVEPVAANGRTVLVWPTSPPLGPAGGGPAGGWVAVHDLATGAELCQRFTIPNTTTEQESPPPLLSVDDIIVLIDGQDIVAHAAHASGEAPAGRELWRLQGLGPSFSLARLVRQRLLWLPDAEHGHGRFIELATGQVMAQVPVDGEDTPLIDGFDCLARQADSHLACWDLGTGRLRWRSEAVVAKVLTARGDSVFVLSDQDQLAVVDRFSGKVRRTFGDWHTISEFAVLDDRLYLYARAKEGGDGFIAVDIASGSPAWEQWLPAKVEVREFRATSQGLTAIIRDDEGAAALILDAQGGKPRAMVINLDHAILPLANGLLDAGPEGLHAMTSSTIEAPTPVPTSNVADLVDLKALAAAALPNLRWQPCGDGSYALARVKSSLVVFARPHADMVVRIGDAGRPIDRQSVVLQMSAQDGGVITLDAPPSTWRLGDHVVVTQGKDQVLVARLEPPADRPAGQPLAVRVKSGGVCDGPDAPWWFSAVWRVVAESDKARPKDKR